MTSRKVLFLEFNEITRTIIDPMIKKGKLPKKNKSRLPRKQKKAMQKAARQANR